MGVGAVVVLQRQQRRDIHIPDEIQRIQQRLRRFRGGGGDVALRRLGKAALIRDNGQIDMALIVRQIAVIQMLELPGGVLQRALIVSRFGANGIAVIDVHRRKRRLRRRFFFGDQPRGAQQRRTAQQHEGCPPYLLHWMASS